MGKALEGGDNPNRTNRVYVHCMNGKNRSATMVIAYLMKSRGLTLFDAYCHTKQCRPGIRPKAGFIHRLAEFELKVHGTSTKDKLVEQLNGDKEQSKDIN